VIAVVAFIVIGPKELPSVLRTVAGLASKARAAGRVFQQQLDEVMREANTADLRRQVDDALRIDQQAAERAVTGAVDPKGEINQIWNEASAIPDPDAGAGAPEYTPTAPSDEPAPLAVPPQDADVSPASEPPPQPAAEDSKPSSGKAS
jgi:sec-independent protein translocase protein TatB